MSYHQCCGHYNTPPRVRCMRASEFEIRDPSGGNAYACAQHLLQVVRRLLTRSGYVRVAPPG